MIVTDKKSELLLKGSAEMLVNTIERLSGHALPVVNVDGANGKLPTDQAIVFATLDALKAIAPKLSGSES